MMRWLSLSALIVVADLLTKYWASHTLGYGQPVEVLPVLNWTLLHNTGAAFSFLANAGGWQRWFFVLVSFVVSIVLLVMLIRSSTKNRFEVLGLALVLGGAVGNLWDRITLGYVVDFIQVHYGEHYFPAFNIADSAITGGVIALIISALFTTKIKYDYSPNSDDS